MDQASRFYRWRDYQRNMTTLAKWKAWAGSAPEFCLDLIGPVRRWKDKKRRDKQSERRRKRKEYAKWAAVQNAVSEANTDPGKEDGVVVADSQKEGT